MNFQTNGVIVILQWGSTVTIHPLKIRGFMQDLGLAKAEKIRIDELSYLTEKLYAEALLDVLSKVTAEEINTTIKNECMACYDPAAQAHSCCLNNSREKVDRNFDIAIQLVDLWSANKMTSGKTKDKIQVTIKDKDLYLTRSDSLINIFFMDRLKAALRKLVL